jgi:2-methylcitrate dehydratase PrpD
MTFKNHACCGHTFAAIDGALALQQRMGVRAEDLAAVHIETYQPALDVAGNPNPQTAAEARFSLPFVVASALVHGSVRLAAFSPERLADAQVRGLMQRLSLRADAQIDAGFPGQRAARVRLVTHDGREDVFFQPNRKGDPEDPLTDADLDGKFVELAAPVIGDTAARVMLQQLWQLEQAAQLP